MDHIVVCPTVEEARMALAFTFGPDATQPPTVRTPEPLRDFVAKWPGRTDEALNVHLHMPFDFDVEVVMGKNERRALELRCSRVTVMFNGEVVGYALRTDDLGLNAIRTWHSTKVAFDRRIRQAH